MQVRALSGEFIMANVSLIQHSFNQFTTTIKGVAPGSQDLIFLDPPYNFGVEYADDPTGDLLDPKEYVLWCEHVAQILNYHLKPGGTLWWLCPSAHMDFVPSIMEKVSLIALYRIIKNETFAQYQQKTLTDDYRMLFVYRKPGGAKRVTFNPDAIRIPSARQEKYGDKRADTRGRVPGQVWTIRRLQGTSDDHVDWHKAQLPPELLHRIVRGWTNPGDNVLDAFAGSGNMGLCCQREGRNVTLIDQSATYIGKIAERLGVRHDHDKEIE